MKKQALFKTLLYLLLFGFFLLMLQITLYYIDFDMNAAFLRIKQWTFRKYPGTLGAIWITSFFIHALTSIFALLAGFTQFNRRFIQNKWHRYMGIFYIIVVLFLSAPSGLIMSFFANGGITSMAGFFILSCLWIFTSYMAYIKALQKDYPSHAKWMYRSYALCLSAITLRIYKYAYVNWIDPEMDFLGPMDLYRIIAWMGWVPNLIVAEYLIFKQNHLQLLKRNH